MEYPLWKEALEYARWAPSPHNVQPWKLKLLSDSEAELYFDPTRLLPVEDPTGRFLMTGFGIFLETLSIALNPKGYELYVKYTNTPLSSDHKDIVLFANISLVPTHKNEDLDRELIKQRRTSRLPYNGKPLQKNVIDELKSIALTFNHTFTFSSDPLLVGWVLNLNKDTMLYDMDDVQTRREVGSWIRYTSREAHKKNDGLWSYCMNIGSVILYLFFKLRWVMGLPGIRTIVGRFYLLTMKGTTTIGWLQGPFQNQEDWIKSGKMLARLWLTMTKYDVCLHPFGSIITNDTAHKRLQDKFALDESHNTMWLIMRLGQSDEPPRSLRLSVDDLIIK